MKNFQVNKLVDHLQNIYALPIKMRKSEQPDQNQLKQTMKKNYKHPWVVNGIIHEDMSLKRLPIGDLDNWQVLRINMSKRSYDYPKNYKGMKIPSASREFNSFNGRDQDGHIPYLFESEISKIENLRQKIYKKPFHRTNTARHNIFGFPSKAITRSKSLGASTRR